MSESQKPMYAMPLYEVKYYGTDQWREISDVELVDQLYRTYHRVTPVIKEMIQGREVTTPFGTYRIKFRGGEIRNTDAA